VREFTLELSVTSSLTETRPVPGAFCEMMPHLVLSFLYRELLASLRSRIRMNAHICTVPIRIAI